MYNKNGIRNGGIDECIIDNFGPGSFCDVMYGKIEKIEEVEYTNHPNRFLYCTIWNESAKDCDFLKVSDSYLKEIEEGYWEDWNNQGDEITLNNITVSKKKFCDYFNNTLI